MARKMKRFASGGSTDRYNRKIADIESDYQKALKSGKAAGVAKAKYEQRMADAKDDLAKWTGADRTASRAAEKASEAALSEARRTKGMSIERRDSVASRMAELDKPIETKRPSTSDIASSVGKAAISKPKPKVRPAAAPKPMARRDATPAPKREAPTPTGIPASIARAGIKDYLLKKDGKTTARKADTSTADYATRLERTAAEKRQRESAPTGYNIWDKLKNATGFGSSADERLARNLRTNAMRRAEAAATIDRGNARAEATTQANTAARKAALIKKAAAERAAGREGNAQYNEREAARLKKGGPVKKYAKGGSINGIAKRGLTRAKMKGSK